MPRRRYLFDPLYYPPEPSLHPRRAPRTPRNGDGPRPKGELHWYLGRYVYTVRNARMVQGLRPDTVKALRSYVDVMNRQAAHPPTSGTLKNVRARAYKLLMSLNRDARRAAAHYYGIALDAQHRPLL
jgi:hypothetical protein